MVALRDPLAKYLMNITTIVIIVILIAMGYVLYLSVCSASHLIYGDFKNITVPDTVIQGESVWVWTQNDVVYYSYDAVRSGEYYAKIKCLKSNKIYDNHTACEVIDFRRVLVEEGNNF